MSYGGSTYCGGATMTNTIRLARYGFLLGLMGLVLGCVISPREGYYDTDHHRYYHERAWHDCGEDHNERCRG
jgi:hypothetical protein